MSDTVARSIIVAGFLVALPFGLYFRLRSHTDERLDRRQEGWFVLLTLRPLAAICMASLLAYLINPNWMAWSAVDLPGWARWTGVVFGVAASGLIVWTFRTLGHNLTDTVVTRRDATLITRGPYRWVRHPFYVAFALAVIANSLVTANVFLAVTGALAFAVIVIRTPIEEQKLLDAFGREYETYRRNTGKFVPRFRTRN